MDLFDAGVSIIDCGSKHNLPLYIAIANSFSMEYLVVHDEDPLPEPIPEDWEEDKIRSKQRTFALNEAIADLVNEKLGAIQIMSPDFEREGGVPRSQGERKGKPLAALDHFDSMSVEQIAASMKDLVRAAYQS